MKRLVLAAVMVLGLAAPALPQNVINPRYISFTASEDHAQVERYVAGWFLPGAQSPTLEVDLGKPTPDASNTIIVAVNVHPMVFGLGLVAKVKGMGRLPDNTPIAGDWSEASNLWDRRPEKAGQPTVSK